MATFSHLASELLTHILKLSTEGETPKEQQRARFSFGLVSRACFLATANATDFYLAGPEQADALISKLEYEKEYLAEEARRFKTRPTLLRPTRLSNVRRLKVTLDDNGIVGKLSALLPVISTSLSALELEIGDLYDTDDDDDFWEDMARYGSLDDALGEVEDLRKLHIVSSYSQFSFETAARLLVPLATLRILHLDIRIFDVEPPSQESQALFTRLALPRLHQLSIVQPPSRRILKALAASPTNLSTLHLGSRHTDYFLDLLPLISTLNHFSWTPECQPLDEGERDAVLTLLGAMSSLETLVLPLWPLGDYNEFVWSQVEIEGETPEWDKWDLAPIDHTVFDVLATLPRLRTVQLIAQLGKLEESNVVSFLKRLSTLHTLSIIMKKTRGWSRKQMERVCAAAEEAGVVFSYKGEDGF